VIGNVCTETIDEVFALLPSLEVCHGALSVPFIEIINGSRLRLFFLIM